MGLKQGSILDTFQALASDIWLEAKLQAATSTDTAVLLLPWTSSLKITSLSVSPAHERVPGSGRGGEADPGPEPTGQWILNWKPPPPTAFGHIQVGGWSERCTLFTVWHCSGSCRKVLGDACSCIVRSPARTLLAQNLDIRFPYDPHRNVDCSALVQLPALSALRLSGAVGYKMAGRSGTLERLSVTYASQDRMTATAGVAARPHDAWLQPDHGLHFLEIPAMPKYAGWGKGG